MNLAELQHHFRAWLVTSSDDAARRLSDGSNAGLAIYQNNYRHQLVGGLEATYPRLREWMGEDAFLAAAVRHIDSTPPHAWTLDAYGDGFPATLSTLYPEHPHLLEFAWIEHALGAAFVAPDAPPLARETLATVNWGEARLQLAPSLLHRAATTNAEQIWDAQWQGAPTPEGEMLEQPGGLIVWRRNYTCVLKQVDALEYEALRQLQADGSFAALCGLLTDRLGDSEGIAKAGALLAAWLGSELITGVTAT
jgi:uncharacterized protein YndB with AHSA1/START domain